MSRCNAGTVVVFASGFLTGFAIAMGVIAEDVSADYRHHANEVGQIEARERQAVTRAGQAEERIRSLMVDLDIARRELSRLKQTQGVKFAEGADVRPEDRIPPAGVWVP